MNATTEPIQTLREAQTGTDYASICGRIRAIMILAKIDDDNGNIEALRHHLADIANLVNTDWTA